MVAANCIASICARPTFLIVATLPETDIISVVRLRNENTPALLEDGSVNPNDISPNDLGAIVKPVMVGVAIFTVKFAVFITDENPGVAACITVITVCPALTIVTVLPDMSATATLLLVNVNVAAGLVLVDTGFVKSNGAVPYTRGATTKFVRIGVMVAIYT